MQFLVKNKTRASIDSSRLRARSHFRCLLLRVVVSTTVSTTVFMTVFMTSARVVVADPNMFLKQAEIDAIKLQVDAGEAPWTGAFDTVIARAQTALTTDLQSVTYQGIVSGNIQWHQDDDHPAAIIMSDSVRTLGLAYAFTGESQYAEKALDFIRTWTLDPVTRMRPTPPGKRIQIYVTMPSLFYGADLISNYGGWDPTEKDGFYGWTQTMGNYVKANGEGLNNFSNWRALMLASAGAMLNDETMLDLAESEYKRLLPLQMQNMYSVDPGRMNLEYLRDSGLHYSLFAINAMIQTAEILDNRGVNVYDYVNGGASLELALDFITPYALNQETWLADGFPQENPITQNNSIALFELAYSYFQKQEYLDVINEWGRPLYENRIMGINTLTHANTFELAVPGLDGDFDLDNDVDGADFLAWQRSGLSASDFEAWEAEFGTAAQLAAASTNVPEPSTGLMLVACCGIYAMRRRLSAA